METPTVAEVVRAIEKAFDGVLRGNGITLHQADAIDDRASEEEQLQARRLDIDSRWQDVPDELIARFSSQLSFVDGEGFRYYIPAFMRWAITHYETSNSFTIDSTIYNFGQIFDFPTSGVAMAVPLFTESQLRAIALFLLHMRSAERVDAKHAQLALDIFWARYAV